MYPVWTNYELFRGPFVLSLRESVSTSTNVLFVSVLVLKVGQVEDENFFCSRNIYVLSMKDLENCESTMYLLTVSAKKNKTEQSKKWMKQTLTMSNKDEQGAS